MTIKKICIKGVLISIYVSLCLLGFSCKRQYIPKPKTYINIELPDKSYFTFDSLPYPFIFELPGYSKFIPVKGNTWADINFPELGATINFTYIANPDLDTCIKNSLFFVEHNLGKANGMTETQISRQREKVYGFVYDLHGPDVATTCQFYLTDSNKHFVRGAFYLNNIPNNDSLAPIIDFIRVDIEHLISTFRWR